MVAFLHARPYLFDREFQELVDASAEAAEDSPQMEADEETLPPAAPAPTFSEAELAAACDAAHADGEKAGRAAAERSIAARAAAVLGVMADQLRTAAAAAGREQTEILRDATAIALTICRKLLPQTYRDTAGEEITRLLSTVLPRISEQPQVFVRVAAPLAPDLSGPVASVVEAAGFSGTVRVVGDDSLAEGDCRIEWSQGGVIRDAATLLREIETVIEKTVGRHPAAAGLAVLPPAAAAADTHSEPEPAAEPRSPAPRTTPSENVINPSQRADTDA